MKKFAILLSLASFVVLAGCATKSTVDQASVQAAAPSHQDLKGEVTRTK